MGSEQSTDRSTRSLLSSGPLTEDRGFLEEVALQRPLQVGEEPGPPEVQWACEPLEQVAGRQLGGGREAPRTLLALQLQIKLGGSGI